jgi:hypothetical protein
MREDWWKAANDALRDKYLVYIEVIGGHGTPTTDGRFSIIATNDLTNSDGDPDTDIDPPYTYATYIWRPFFADQTPDASGKIEVRLHYQSTTFRTYDKMWQEATYFDDITLYY